MVTRAGNSSMLGREGEIDVLETDDLMQKKALVCWLEKMMLIALWHSNDLTTSVLKK